MEIPKLGTPEFAKMLNDLIKLQIQLDTTDKILKIFVGSLRDAMETKQGCGKAWTDNGTIITCGQDFGKLYLCEKCRESTLSAPTKEEKEIK